MSRSSKILITGASGFIGGWLVETIYLSGRAGVRAGIHRWMSAARLARFPLDIVLCDVLSSTEISDALSNVTHVVHCAYGSDETTIEGTRNMLNAASEKGVERFVHISTTDVYGRQDGIISEETPFESTGQAYSAAKIKAEELCWEKSQQGLPVTVIRPPIVYGPFGRTWTIDLAAMLRSGGWSLLEGTGEGICNLIYVRDLAEGILLALEHPAAVGEAFNLRGPDLVTWNEYWRNFNAALGLPPLEMQNTAQAALRAMMMEPIRTVGKFALARFEGILRYVTRRSRRTKRLLTNVEKAIKSTPRPYQLGLFDRKADYTPEKAIGLLGFQPNYGLEEGLNLTVRWLSHVGLADEIRE